jgi:hypothetical protein
MVKEDLNLTAWRPPKSKSNRPGRHIDVFSVESDLSSAERSVIAGFMRMIHSPVDPHVDVLMAREAERFEHCGRPVGLRCDKDNTLYFIRQQCRSRICEPCARRYLKRLDLHQRVKVLLAEARRNSPKNYILAQVTLTISSRRFGDCLPDKAGIRRLYQESRDLFKLYFGSYVCRRSKSGKIVEKRRSRRGLAPGQDSRIWLGAGWIAVVEIGRDNNNLHIHALTWGPYRSVRMLRDEWSQITGDSFGVDIRAKSFTDSVRYVVKYIAKSPQTDSYIRLAEYAGMIKGSRRFRSGGIFYGKCWMVKMDARPMLCFLCQSRLRFEGPIEDVESASALDYFAIDKKLKNDLSGNVLQEIESKLQSGALSYNMPF